MRAAKEMVDQVEALSEALRLTNPVIHAERHRALFEVYLSLHRLERYEKALIEIAGGAFPPDEIASQTLRKNDDGR